ncbi:hypothetical protein QJU96_08315 [Pasteurella skyensis]|uniref:hypothetical protein n=1 Tax=Phocoenobacter skyensis TaxID=97481 RepID=UPI0027947CD6|nr:hypothetical protein [Pasteurella skyensis]MDP8171289.1 hypothetical protein [Pasteurella skyensis]
MIKICKKLKIDKIKILILLFLFIFLCSFYYKNPNINSIKIDKFLADHLNYNTVFGNYRFKQLIEKSLNKDINALIEIKNVDCGGGSYCYSLGYVITQIIKRIGEQEFIKIYEQMPKKDQKEIIHFIYAGLEYGDNDYDGKMDNEKIENVYPNLYKIVHQNND